MSDLSFVSSVVSHHESLLADDEARDAVITKAISLLSLAFELPQRRNEPFNAEECITNLREALAVIERKRGHHATH